MPVFLARASFSSIINIAYQSAERRHHAETSFCSQRSGNSADQQVLAGAGQTPQNNPGCPDEPGQLRGSGTAGYLLASSKPALAAPVDDRASIAAFNDRLADQDDLCATIEQINLAAAAGRRRKRLIRWRTPSITQQEEIDSLEETILNALMANLTDQLISRSSKSIDAYQRGSQNLIALVP